MTRLSKFPVLILCGCLSWSASARADAVVDWNAIAVQAILTATPGRPGPSGFLDIAIVHAAVYDAVEAIDGRYQLYHLTLPGASGSTAAAAARAAHDVLVNRFPGESASLDTTYHDYLAGHGLSETDPGVAVGQQAAAGIIAPRANDRSFPNPPPPPFTGGTGLGVWRPTISYLPGPPPSFAPMETEWLANVVPFTLNSPSQFRAQPPPALTSRRYARNYNEVKSLGALLSSTRTFDQTDLAYFWATNYLASWNGTLRNIASEHLSEIGESARLFALATMVMADAGITAWDSKRHYVFWRPITAIQEGDRDGNPKTAGDPDWQPLLNTPNYPDYTSGATNVTAAVTRILALFFRTDEMIFSVTTTNPLAIQQTRTYSRFSDAAEDVVSARVYEGIHFRFTDLAARRQGGRVASWAFRHFLRPVEECDDHEDRQDERGDDGR
jgi:PAP2 superfamily